jgi:transglutaminase-like putative cysteine protease
VIVRRLRMIMKHYLGSSDCVDWQHPLVSAKARELAAGSDDCIEIARRCFEFVRDEIRHSWDYQLNPVTCRASEVLIHGTGYCYAKSHLLAALLRANSIPAGLCYQRLSRGDSGPLSAQTEPTASPDAHQGPGYEGFPRYSACPFPTMNFPVKYLFLI